MMYDIYANSTVTKKEGWVNKKISWKDFVKKLKTPITKKYTMSYYNGLKEIASKKIKDVETDKEKNDIKNAKNELQTIKDSGCFIPGRFQGSIRQDKYLLYRSMISLDLDDCDIDIFDKIEEIPYKHVWHTTHSSTNEKPRLRVFIPLKKVINTKEEYKSITLEFCNRHGLLDYIDKASLKANQVMFMPSIPCDSTYSFKEVDGSLLNPYDYLVDKKEQQNKKRKKTINKIKDLSERDGIDVWGVVKEVTSPYDMHDAIGRFCRKYTIAETIDKFLSEVYTEGSIPDTYTYVEGSSLNGLKIYPDKKGNSGVFAYSFHNTDPLNDGYCHTSFDILKVHRFKGDVIATLKFIKKDLGIKEKFAINTKAGHEATYYHLNDKGKPVLNTEKLIEHLLDSEEHKSFNTENGFYMYEDNVYKNKSQNEICKIISNHLVSSDITANFVNNIYTQLGWNTKSIDLLNTRNDIITFNNIRLQFKENGEYDTLDHDSDFLNTYKINHDFMPGITCELWQKFLDDILPAEQQKLLQEIMGYIMLPDNSAKKFFSLFGVGDSGKSVILKTMIRIIGNHLVSATPLQDLGNPNNRFCKYTLYGMLANVVGDMSSARINDTSIIKMLTGDDIIQAERKRHDQFNFYNKARLFCSMNVLPPISDRSKEFFNRMIIIPFTTAVPENKRIKKLEKKFNISGVINWCLEGLSRLLSNDLNFSITNTNKKLVADYEKDNNSVTLFVSECLCKIDDSKAKKEPNDTGIATKNIYIFYKKYCETNGNKPVASRKLVTEIKALNIYKYSEHVKVSGSRARGFIAGFNNMAYEEYMSTPF
jgi:putative DNA primase/helicase